MHEVQIARRAGGCHMGGPCDGYKPRRHSRGECWWNYLRIRRMSSEQYQYMVKTRRSELASEAQKFSKLAEQVNKLEPEATLWQNRGYLFIAVGGALLLLSLFRFFSRVCSRKDEDISEPLLDTPPGHIHMHQYEHSQRNGRYE